MKLNYITPQSTFHRLIPSRFPPINLFDWADSEIEKNEIADLEGLTNERLIAESGDIQLVSKKDWVCEQGASSLMAPFTHPGCSRFSDGSYGVYYAGDSLDTAVSETKYHRERFLSASNEQPCLIQMREYIVNVVKELVDISETKYKKYLHQDPNRYSVSQAFGRELRINQEWGVHYPSVRRKGSHCIAIFRPPAISIPIQGCHLDYIWDGTSISHRRSENMLDTIDKK